MSDGQDARARQFAALHVKGNPLILYNVWDVGSAKAVATAGAAAIATGSWSVAAAHGFEDGEEIPLDRVIDLVARIVSAIDVPLTLDFESGYASGGAPLAENIRRIIDAGAVGINFEDQMIGRDALYSVEQQCERIATAREAAGRAGVSLFINARTDVFLRTDPAHHPSQLGEAIARGAAYAAAGASGFFVPGLRDGSMITRVCAESSLPVNVMFHPDAPAAGTLAASGVARISYGPRPYRDMVAWLTASARAALRGGAS